VVLPCDLGYKKWSKKTSDRTPGLLGGKTVPMSMSSHGLSVTDSLRRMMPLCSKVPLYSIAERDKKGYRLIDCTQQVAALCIVVVCFLETPHFVTSEW